MNMTPTGAKPLRAPRPVSLHAPVFRPRNDEKPERQPVVSFPQPGTPMAVKELKTADFDTTISNNDIVILDFWAPWCGPCKNFAPVFESVSNEHPDIVFAKINTDEETSLAGHFGIRSIPTLMVFRERVIVFQQAGALPKGALDDLIRQIRDLDMEEIKRGAQPYSADNQQG